MYLEFSKVTIQAFKTFTGDPVVFKLTGGQPGLRFIKGRNEDEPELGSNGSGKSSILDALSWCLFGQTVDGLRTPDIIPWSNEGSPHVSVNLRTDDVKHTVIRSTKPNKTLIDNLEAGQEEIDQLLGFNFEVFRHTILFGQDQPLFFDLAPKAKMEVLGNALNLDRWELRSAAASDEVKELVSDLAKLKENIAADEAVLTESRIQFKEAKVRIDTWEQERKAHIKDTGDSIKQLITRAQQLSTIHDRAELAADSAGTECKALNAKINELLDRKAEAQSAYDKGEVLVEGLKDVVHALLKERAMLGEKATTCPTCGQSLAGTALARHRKELDTRIQVLTAKVKAGTPKGVTLALENASTTLTQAREHLKNFDAKENLAQTELRQVGPELVAVRTNLRNLEEQQKERTDEVNPHREQLQDLRKTISQLETNLASLDKRIAKLDAEQARVAFWVKGFKDVRLYLLEELLQELELATNALLPESGLRDWQVFYAIEKETKKGTMVSGLTVFVQSPHNKKPVRWENWSGGEQHRLRLVGALALSEVLLNYAGVNTNLEALDEPTRNLSVEGVQDLCEFLASRAQQLDKDIFLTGHNVIESAHFTDTITIVKEKGASSYIENNAV
jgi:DNA repair exonuclease SbcCD ATPase subunit